MTERKGIWGKIKSQYGTASAAISGLSLTSTEHDGDEESDTIIHNALARYYTTKDGRLPPWLGVESRNGDVAGNVYGTRRPDARVSEHTKSSSSLQDIYARRQQQQQQQASQAPTANRVVPERSKSFAGVLGPGAADRTDKYRNKLKSAGRANW
jgi:hypothetical protein